jgi:hypothetical protein
VLRVALPGHGVTRLHVRETGGHVGILLGQRIPGGSLAGASG